MSDYRLVDGKMKTSVKMADSEVVKNARRQAEAQLQYYRKMMEKKEGTEMTKEQAIDLLMFLSAVESWALSDNHHMPSYLHDQLTDNIALLKAIALGEQE